MEAIPWRFFLKNDPDKSGFEEVIKIKNNYEAYRDDRYVIGCKDGLYFIKINEEKYRLTCHPYEPCLYITDENGNMTAVHNAFDPSVVLEIFAGGDTVTSITGFEYDALDFCKMVEYAANMVDVQIDEAEKVFRGSAKKKKPEPEKKKEQSAVTEKAPRPESGRIIEDDPAYDVISQYPDSAVDFCLVVNEHISTGYNAHWYALLWASRKLFIDENDEAIWQFDVGKADAKQIGADELFTSDDKNGELSYRKAFLEPPYTNNYTNADFEKLNAALFPNGTDGLEVYEWTTDWSEYFDEGHEWWGALCYTVFDNMLNRFVVIMASATD